MPTKLPQTPFSKDHRDPYWQTRVSTVEAGALALEKLQSVDDKLALEKTYIIERAVITLEDLSYGAVASDGTNIPEGAVFHLPEGWWELTDISFLTEGSTDVQRLIIYGSHNSNVIQPNIVLAVMCGFWWSNEIAIGAYVEFHNYSKNITAVETWALTAGTNMQRGPCGGIFHGGMNKTFKLPEKLCIAKWATTGAPGTIAVTGLRAIFHRIPDPNPENYPGT